MDRPHGIERSIACKNIDPRGVVVFRHRPYEPELNKVFPLLAADRPHLFNAYQQTHGEKVEKAMTSAKHVASFIRHGSGKALFVGFYAIDWPLLDHNCNPILLFYSRLQGLTMR